jgi:hypothetical protein
MMTNNDFNIIDLPIFYSFAILVISLSIYNIKSKNIKSFSSFILYFLLTMAIIYALKISINRFRIRAIGPGMFYELSSFNLSKKSNNVFFKDLITGNNLINTIKNIDLSLDKINKNNFDEKVFFGPRIDFGYASHKIKPIKGLPLWWGEGPESGGVPKSQTVIALNNLFKAKPLIGIFYDFTFLPSDLINYFENNYKKCLVGNLTVYYLTNLKINCEVN